MNEGYCSNLTNLINIYIKKKRSEILREQNRQGEKGERRRRREKRKVRREIKRS